MNQILHTYPLEHPVIRQVTFHQWGAILACQNTSSGRDTQPYRGCETEKPIINEHIMKIISVMDIMKKN